jgi:hypothetical protein
MNTQGLRAGHLAALVGAGAALVSLALPWYTIHIPDAVKRAFGGVGRSGGGADPSSNPMAGAFAELARGLAAMLPEQITATGWQALRGADVALCAGALAVILLVLATAGAFGRGVRIDAAVSGRWISILAGAGLVLTTYHAIWRPGGEQAAAAVDVRHGLWVAAAGCLLAMLGGAMASSGGTAPAPAAGTPRWGPAPLEDDDRGHVPLFDVPASVPPPGARVP